MTNFSDVMTKRSDSELLEIVTTLRNDYQSDAVEAAELEIKNRNLSFDRIEKAEEELRIKEQILQAKADQTLELGQKILFFIFFWGIIPWAMAGTFKSKGYLRKHKEAWKFMKYGFLGFLGFWVVMVGVYILTSSSNKVEISNGENINNSADTIYSSWEPDYAFYRFDTIFDSTTIHIKTYSLNEKSKTISISQVSDETGKPVIEVVKVNDLLKYVICQVIDFLILKRMK